MKTILKTTWIPAGIIAVSLLLASALPASAQYKQNMPANSERNRQVSGRYGGMDGICLFEDGRFMLYGYATAVFGNYTFEKDYILFTPDKPDRFGIYAGKNKKIGDSTRLYFQGFEEGATFVQVDQQQLRRVFNEDANCFNAPYIYTAAKTPAVITLFDKVEDEGWYRDSAVTAWQYGIDKGYNDFMIVYNKPHRYYNDFSGMITQGPEGSQVLQVSANFGSRMLEQHPATEEDHNWREILEWKASSDHSKADGDALYANTLYNVFATPNTLNYKYDAALDLYVNILNKDNDSYYQDNAYNDDRYLRKYIKLQPQKKDNPPAIPQGIAAAPVFYTVCEGDKGKE